MSFSSKRFDLKDVSDFDDFCGEYRLNLDSVNQGKANKLSEHISRGDRIDNMAALYDDDYANFIEAAAYLFSVNKISREQIATLLEYSAVVHFPRCHQVSLFDGSNQLTENAKILLTHFLPNSFEIDNFVSMVKQKPRSEQCFFELEIPSRDFKNDQLVNLLGLGAKLKIIKTDSLVLNHSFAQFARVEKSLKVTIFSVGARDVMASVIYGANAKRLLPRLGKLSKQDIERSMMNDARYSAVGFPGIDSEGEFHNIKASLFYQSLHDEFHRALTSSIPMTIYNAALYAVDVIRRGSGVTWSKEIWDTIDMEVGELHHLLNVKKDDDSLANQTILFFKLLTSNVYTEHRPKMMFDPNPIFDTTWLLLIDFVLSPDEWLKLGVDVKLLEAHPGYSMLYTVVNDHVSVLKKLATAAEQVAMIKGLYFDLPWVNVKSAKFVKEKGSNYIDVHVDGKPLVMSKSQYKKFLSEGIDIYQLANGNPRDIIYINSLSNSDIHLLNSRRAALKDIRVLSVIEPININQSTAHRDVSSFFGSVVDKRLPDIRSKHFTDITSVGDVASPSTPSIRN